MPINTGSFPSPSNQNPTVLVVNSQNSNKKKWLVIAIILIFLVLISTAILWFKFKSGSVKPLTQVPVQTSKLLVSVAGEKIYLNELQARAEKQYAPSLINKTILSQFLDRMIEHKILDVETGKAHILVSDNEIQAELGKQTAAVFQEEAKYRLLKQKITLQTGGAKKANIIGFWIPDTSYPQKPEYAQQRALAKPILTEIEALLNKNTPVLTAAKLIYDKYPVMQPVIAVNGTILQNTHDTSNISTPKVFEINKDNQNSEPYKTIFSLGPKQTKVIFDNNDSGGQVVQTAEDLSATSSTYDEWLKTKKKEFVVTYNSL